MPPGERFEALWRAHETLIATTGGIGEALGRLSTGDDGLAIDGLARALNVLRAHRGGGNLSWLDLYCTTPDATSNRSIPLDQGPWSS